jgi:hypothetical protein
MMGAMRTIWVGSAQVEGAPTINAELPPTARDTLSIGEHLLLRAISAPTQEAQVTAVNGPRVTLVVLGRTVAAVDHDRGDPAGPADAAETDIPAVVPATHPTGVGALFRRPMTDTELSTVRAWIAVDGAAAGIRTLWKLLVWAADGTTYDEAHEVTLDRSAYAIPASQAAMLVSWLAASPPDVDVHGSWRWERQVGYLWAGTGPASYDDRPSSDDAPYPADPLD